MWSCVQGVFSVYMSGAAYVYARNMTRWYLIRHIFIAHDPAHDAINEAYQASLHTSTTRITKRSPQLSTRITSTAQRLNQQMDQDGTKMMTKVSE